MRNVIILEQVQNRISQYSENYRVYYEELYSDSGIWSEEQIIDGYIREARQREKEIYALIQENFSKETLLIHT